MKKVSYATAILLLTAICFSCKKEEDITPQGNLIQEYVPLAVGNQWIYTRIMYEEDSVTVRRKYDNDTIKIIAYEWVDGRPMYKVENQLPLFFPNGYWYVEGQQLIEYDPELNEKRVIFSLSEEGEVFQNDTISDQVIRSSYIKSYDGQYEVNGESMKLIELVTELLFFRADRNNIDYRYDFYRKGKGLVVKVGYYSSTNIFHHRWELIDCTLN